MGSAAGITHLIDSDGHPRRLMKGTLKMTLLKKSLLAASAAVLAAPAIALAAPTVGDSVGTTLQEVTNALASAGYEVREVEMDGRQIEALVLVDGQWLELEISPETGMIISVELDEDDDDDDRGN
jgi:hypothetical protein